jgi:hypothetical protein
MEAKELRIGNYVNKPHVRMGKVVCIFKTHFQVEDEECISLGNSIQEHFEPIKITGKLLMDLGALEIPENRFHVTLYCFEGLDSQKWCVGCVDGNWSLFEDESDAGCLAVNFSELKYIHKLQNLLFEVANVELTIK